MTASHALSAQGYRPTRLKTLQDPQKLKTQQRIALQQWIRDSRHASGEEFVAEELRAALAEIDDVRRGALVAFLCLAASFAAAAFITAFAIIAWKQG